VNPESHNLTIQNERESSVFQASLTARMVGLLTEAKWRNFAFWTALLLTGQEATLQMIDAGRAIHFQYYRSLPESVTSNLIVVILFAVQIVSVTYGIAKHLPAIASWLNKSFARWQIFRSIFRVFQLPF
jgi:hypothetical protein